MSYQVQLIIPDEVMEQLPENKADWIPYLASFFERSVIKPYEESLSKRQKGMLGGPLSKYEKTGYTDLLIDIALGQIRKNIEESASTQVPLE